MKMGRKGLFSSHSAVCLGLAHPCPISSSRTSAAPLPGFLSRLPPSFQPCSPPPLPRLCLESHEEVRELTSLQDSQGWKRTSVRGDFQTPSRFSCSRQALREAVTDAEKGQEIDKVKGDKPGLSKGSLGPWGKSGGVSALDWSSRAMTPY